MHLSHHFICNNLGERLSLFLRNVCSIDNFVLYRNFYFLCAMQNDLSIVFIPAGICISSFVNPADISDAQIVNDENIRDGQTDVAK